MTRPAASPVVWGGQPAVIRFDGRHVWLWWGQDERGLDVVAASAGRVLTFPTEAACRAALAPTSSPSVWSTAEPRPTLELVTGSANAAGPLLLLGPDHLRAPDGESVAPGPGPVTLGPEMADLGPAQEWAAGRRLVIPAESALDLWNWGVDIARSTGRPFVQRGLIRDACYTKLVAAQVPWMFDRRSYRPTWRPAQLTALRSTLNDAIHLIRSALR
jgi:hypothetical protein